MPPFSQRRRTNNTSNNSRGSSTLRRRSGRQVHLNFAPPPTNDDAAPPLPIELDPTTRRAPSEPANTPEPSAAKNKRWAWIFQHMPSENINERYYDEISGKEIWRCGYCPKTYHTNSGTRLVEEHLAIHNLKKGDPRGTAVSYSDSTQQQPLENSLKRQFELGEEYQFKRRNMGFGGDSIDPNRLELLYTR